MYQYHETDGWSTLGNDRFSPGEPYQTRLAAADDGTVFVAYRDNMLPVVNRFGAGDTTWTNVGPGSAVTTTQVGYMDFAMLSDGTPIVAFVENNAPRSLQVLRFDGTDWTPYGAPTAVDGALHTAVHVDDNDVVTVAYSNFGISFWSPHPVTVLRSNGAEWSRIGSEGFASTGDEIRLARSRTGTTFLAYEDVDDDRYHVMSLD